LQVPLLNLFDGVPSNAKVACDVLDGHVPREVQGIALKGMGILTAGLC
jgi:hypothetical protein